MEREMKRQQALMDKLMDPNLTDEERKALMAGEKDRRAKGKGGGGGGAGNGIASNTSTGGSGVVILAYPDTFSDLTTVSGGLTYTKTTSGGNKIYKFTAGTGTITV